MCELSLNVLDIAQNSLSAGASVIEIVIDEDEEEDRIVIEITDNGCGMDEDFLKTVTDPFSTSRTTRKVGLGIPLLKMDAELAGGTFNIWSKPGEGTRVCASFGLRNVNRAPLGDIKSTISALLAANYHVDIVYTHSVNKKSYTMDTREFRHVLGDSIWIDTPQVAEFISSYLLENEKEIYGGAN